MSKKARAHFIGAGVYVVWVAGVLGAHYYFTGIIW
jgi:hypothetical protein